METQRSLGLTCKMGIICDRYTYKCNYEGVQTVMEACEQ